MKDKLYIAIAPVVGLLNYSVCCLIIIVFLRNLSSDGIWGADFSAIMKVIFKLIILVAVNFCLAWRIKKLRKDFSVWSFLFFTLIFPFVYTVITYYIFYRIFVFLLI